MLTMYHQLRPLTLWASMLLGRYVMDATPHLSARLCRAAAGCYLLVLVMTWRFLSPRTTGEALKRTSRLRGLSNTAAGAEADPYLSGFMPARPPCSSPIHCGVSPVLSSDSPALWRWLLCYLSQDVDSPDALGAASRRRPLRWPVLCPVAAVDVHT